MDRHSRCTLDNIVNHGGYDKAIFHLLNVDYALIRAGHFSKIGKRT